jgi:5-hydroxyisourate hydrolase-like protein (transthyretin family)
VVTLPAESEVVIRMRPARTAGALSGTVTDSSRKPIAGARISLFDTSDGRALTRTQTDRPGTYKFAKMREGYYVVRCFADGFAETRSSQGAVMILANREARLDFNLEAGLQIRGVVVTQKGDPVLQATVFLIAEDGQRPQSSQVATTDEQGRFQVSGLRDSQYLVTVQHRDFLDLATRIRPSNQVQTLTLDGGLSLTGTISDVRGAAVGKFVMTFLSASSRYSKSCPFTTTDGRFEVRGLPRDSYLIRLQAGSNSYAGPLDLQSSTDVFISLDVPRGSRGMIPLNILKAK